MGVELIGKTKKILIIEDDASLSTPLAAKFQSEGYEVHKMSDGNAALDYATQNHPDLILLDIIMPKMDGLTFLEMLRDDDWGETAKVILFSNIMRPGYKEQAEKFHVDAYLLKSQYGIEEIAQKVREVISSSEVTPLSV